MNGRKINLMFVHGSRVGTLCTPLYISENCNVSVRRIRWGGLKPYKTLLYAPLERWSSHGGAFLRHSYVIGTLYASHGRGNFNERSICLFVFGTLHITSQQPFGRW